MNEELRKYLDNIFENAPKTRKALDLKAELYSNSMERYEDLIHKEVSPEDAYKNVIHSIGDVTELFIGLEERNEEDRKKEDDIVKKVALYKAAACGLYIFGFVVFIIACSLDNLLWTRVELSMIGFIVMILIYIIPTCLLVYICNAYPKYKMKEDTVVEEFKEWSSGTKANKSIKSAVTSVMWTLLLVIYFSMSFATGAWHVTWILFLAGVCIQTVIHLYFKIKELR